MKKDYETLLHKIELLEFIVRMQGDQINYLEKIIEVYEKTNLV